MLVLNLRRTLLVVSLATLIAVIALTVMTLERDSGGDDDMTEAEAESFTGFPLYWVGESFEDLDLAYIDHTSSGGYDDIPGQSVVNIGYGDCDPPRYEGGCALPLSIQIWPSCQRNPSIFSVDTPQEHKELTIRGTPAVFYDEGDDAWRLEIFTDDINIVIWTYSNEQTLRAADALHRIGAPMDTTSPNLPQPVPGALDGTGRCPLLAGRSGT